MAQAEAAAQGIVREYLQNEREERPPPPFNTTMFVAEANRMGFGAAQAMRIAEDLYQSGFISYPRTDNTVYPSTVNLRSVLEKLADSPFGAEARELTGQERIVPSRGRTEATDHPPIYPVQGAGRDKVKRDDHWRIYELVVRRFFATVAPNAVAEVADRKFIEGKYPRPTTSGRALIEALEDHAERITQPEMTAHLEADMEGIATGVRAREDVVRESQQMLSEVLETLEANREAIGQEIEAALREQNYIGKCNVCKEGNLTVIRSRRGSGFLGCDPSPASRKTHPCAEIEIIQGAEENCPECGAPMIKHTDPGRTTTSCVAPHCPSGRERHFIRRLEKLGSGESMIR